MRAASRAIRQQKHRRRGITTILSAVLVIVLLGMVAFAVDLGYISMVKGQAQDAADIAALAAGHQMMNDMASSQALAVQFAGYNRLGEANVPPGAVSLEFGLWNSQNRSFTPTGQPGNAIRSTVRRDTGHGGEVPLFFAPVLGINSFSCEATAVCMACPRDIAFVIDLSGSMNNDTEPAWATSEIDRVFGPLGYPDTAEELMQQVYTDFGYGAFPGTLQYVGKALVPTEDQYSYAELTKNSGPLTLGTIAAQYRILNTDNESTRKTKAYKWMIDNQIATVMPGVQPTPVSSNAASYAYWEKYLDYIMRSQQITSSSPKGRPRPSYPVTLPPSQSSYRIDGMGNPYYDSFPDANSTTPGTYRNKIGYRTYVNFMMDYGRDGQPVSGQYTPLSQFSPHCPRHSEATDGGTFSFPPSEQPTHAARRALISSLQLIADRNASVPDSNQRDWVSIVTYDAVEGVTLLQSLTSDYSAAMQACTNLQAVRDINASTATESGLLVAKNHLKPSAQGGQGRIFTDKIVVLLTDGIANLKTSSTGTISSFIAQNPSPDFDGMDWYQKAALMQTMEMELAHWYVFPVGVGLGTDYGFMDRAARLGGTAKDGQAPRGEGNPAIYEERLKDIFEDIIIKVKPRLVQ